MRNKPEIIKHYKVALTIAGSDSGGGAGIQADLKTFAALGCYGASVITALTAQNTQGVQEVQAIPAEFVTSQLNSVLDDLNVSAIKIGMLHSVEVIQAVSKQLDAHKDKGLRVVLDPVMVATSGDPLLHESAVEALKTELMPKVDLITPNIHEAELLCGSKIQSRDDMANAANLLTVLGARAVLIKGGHLDGNKSADLLRISLPVAKAGKNWIKKRRLDTKNTHGTGCTLSSAITAFLAQGHELKQAVALARDYLHKAMKAGAQYQLGQGHGPVHHFYSHWK